MGQVDAIGSGKLRPTFYSWPSNLVTKLIPAAAAVVVAGNVLVDDESVQSIKLRRSSCTANHTTPKHVIGKHVGLLAYPASLSSPAHHEARRWSLSSLVLVRPDTHARWNPGRRHMI